MNTAQIVQTFGFFWLAATGLLLSAETRSWGYPDFVGPLCGVTLYLTGRNWEKVKPAVEPWCLIISISALALLHANLFFFVFGSEISRVSLASLLIGGTIAGGLGLKLRAQLRQRF